MARLLPPPQLLLLLLLAAAGCGRDPEVRTYRLEYPPEANEPARPAQALPSGHPPLATDLSTPPMDAEQLPPTARPDPSAPQPYAWDAPASWQPQPASSMRLASYLVPGSGGETGDFSVIRLAGDAGGLVNNVNRWRGQVGLAPAAEAAIRADLETLPTQLDSEAQTIRLDGPDGQSLFAAILPHDGMTLFFKLIGPTVLVADAVPDFRTLVESFRPAATEPATAE